MTLTAQQAQTFCLPDVGEGLTEAEIVAWHVAPGDSVKINQVIVEIETAKSIVELPSPFDGVVASLLAEVGESVPVGAGIISVETPAAQAAGGDVAEAEAAESEAAEVEAAKRQAAANRQDTPKLLVGYGATDHGQSRRRRRHATPAESPAPANVQNAQDPGLRNHSGAVRAKPPVRGLAKQLGIDLRSIAATGPNGIVSREDVLRAEASQQMPVATAQQTAIAQQNATAQQAAPTRIPIKGVRKATAAAMVTSAFTAPHVTEFITLDVTATLDLLAVIQQRPEFCELKLTPLTLVARAYLLAIARTPMAIAHWDESAQEIVLPASVNLGIAAATPRGLLVPNIKGAEQLKLDELAAAISDLAATARSGKTPQSALSGGSTTITNIGVFGIDTGTPILNPGETSILAVGTIQRRPWVVGAGEHERIEPRSILQLALSFDHRVLDGAEGSRLLADTAAILRNPGLALL
ncbi:dihydrolipoamide acetyltransferase family protein [Leucobacter sp. UT-8R-CII-1-4]|uniref:dihydrolipoamide acetyltransferase family protein n=1 Tax=Leucobacter sp. UT-8R-CII-1-4 TaxID=3040075 RepID=UPI0024A98368|nr:dihydrolipoamide acetyltransferase family protein [Leucobacter sp. UT-8R-CII-1-4]MDI6022744.1 dihydrolipoamide acetyltransferase family protein [Leucobacter sp. UT-8R-CII-1-4]